ncbi:hypothetical protein [Flavobacterium plurextorum]|nr:hypothetical protein [Flavobacterium plurextorum]
MSRTADYTIQGFIYQFIITLQKIIEDTSDSEITIEGIIEDIDILTPLGYEVFQCKYHECKTKFTLSDIYKPVLQMLFHFKNNQTAGIKYRLHAHFPNETVGSIKKLNKTEIEQILKSEAKAYKMYTAELTGFAQIDEFIDVFEIHFGASLADTEKSVIVSLSREGFSTEDAEEIFYPNAIHAIAEYSIKHIETERIVKKSTFLNNLRSKKKTAITRWTRELQSYDKLLKQRRKQLRDNLNINSRVRLIVLDSNYISDFETKASNLILDFVVKYNNKIKLNQCPIFSLICEEDVINSIWRKIASKNVIPVRGIEAGVFDIKRFLREPLKNSNSNIEFKVRLCNHENDFDQVHASGVADEIFIISDNDFPFEITSTSNIEKIKTPEINEIKYLLSLTTTL